MEFGGAEGLDAVSRCSVAMVGEVASSSSSKTFATTVAAEDEYSESSSEGVRCQLAFCGGLESNLKLSVKHIYAKIIFRTHQSEALPGTPRILMGNK